MKFKSQVCTSHIQSELLLSLGLKKETADMWYLKMIKDYKGNEIPETRKKWWLTFDGVIPGAGFEQYVRLPAWSLHRLIELYSDVEDTSSLCIKDVSYKLLIFCIEKAIHCGFFNKDYLEEKK